MTQWYYSDYQRNRLGPVPASALAELHVAGQLSGDTLVWREGLEQWRPWREMVGEVVPGAGRPAVEQAAFATATGDSPADAPANPYEIAEPRSPYAPPTATLAEHEAFVDGGEVVYAGFWKRFAALVIDSFLVGMAYYAVFIVLLLVFGVGLGALTGNVEPSSSFLVALGIGYLMYPVISGLYFVWMESSARQATLGKMAVGIKVVDAGGHRLARGHALGRWASHLLCYFTLYIGYIMAGFTERKRGLHDMVAGTLVVDQWAFTPYPERQRHELGVVTIVVMALALLMLVGYIGVVIFALVGLANVGQ